MQHAKQSGGTAVVVKPLRPDSNELAVLRYLRSIEIAHNYTNLLLETAKLNMWTSILLRKQIHWTSLKYPNCES